MLYFMNWLTYEFWTQIGGWEFDRFHGAGTSSPSHWQQVEEHAPKPLGWRMCFLLMIFGPSRSSVYMHAYIYIYIYIYTQQECHSVLVKLHPITFYRTISGSARFLGWMSLFGFFGLPIVLLSDSLILGCLWIFVFVLNNTLILGIWCSAISHLTGCFGPWTFFQHIGFNMVPSDPFI